MSFAIWIGLAAVVLAGMLQGLFAVPMKYAPRWNYENIWLIFSLVGMVVLPWMLTTATVPHLVEVYSLSLMPVLVRIADFGLCWGIGSALAGLGMNLLGIGLGMAIILGLSASLGSLIPLLILSPQQLHTSQGRTYLVGTAIMLAGIAFCARAGMLRDAARNRGDSSPHRSFFARVEFFLRIRRRCLGSRTRSWRKPAMELWRCDRTGCFWGLHLKLGLLRLSSAQERHAGKFHRRGRRHRLGLRCTHGPVLVRRAITVCNRHNLDGSTGSRDRLAFAHGHDHCHEQRSWGNDW